jgi:hypothetical protein
MEAIVAKLSGFAKFEVKTKVSEKNFTAIMKALSTDDDEGLNAKENFDLYISIFERIGAGEVPFTGDLENEQYKHILACFREIKFE